MPDTLHVTGLLLPCLARLGWGMSPTREGGDLSAAIGDVESAVFADQVPPRHLLLPTITTRRLAGLVRTRPGWHAGRDRSHGLVGFGLAQVGYRSAPGTYGWLSCLHPYPGRSGLFGPPTDAYQRRERARRTNWPRAAAGGHRRAALWVHLPVGKPPKVLAPLVHTLSALERGQSRAQRLGGGCTS
jgi:hypothetical protein